MAARSERTDEAQRLARGLNPYHAVTYFSGESRAAYEEAGLSGFWRGYFAGRAAPMGMVSAPAVIATFYGFAPHMVERAVPDVWRRAAPEVVLAARLAGVDRTMRIVLGDEVCSSPRMARAAELAGALADACQDAGRPLGAANRALPVPDEPHLALWQATTTLREDRGDAHLAILDGYGIGGCESLALMVGIGASTKEWELSARGWTEEEWAAGCATLVERAALDADGVATAEGRELRRAIEQRTDDLAAAVFDRAGEAGTPERVDELLALVEPYTTAIIESETVPFPNPIGLPKP